MDNSKMFFYVVCFVFAELFMSCGSTAKRGANISGLDSNHIYKMEDASGIFTVKRESKVLKNKKELATKIIVEDNQQHILEKNIIISTPGFFMKDTPALRPKRSQTTMWMDNQKFFSDKIIDPQKRSVTINNDFPEAFADSFKAKEEVILPINSGLFCFFSQIHECIKATKFYELAIQKEFGEMNFVIIFDGYPFWTNLYEGIKNKLYASAKCSYEEKDKSGDYKFSVFFDDQMLTYVLDQQLNLKSYYWMRQGIKMILEKKEQK